MDALRLSGFTPDPLVQALGSSVRVYVVGGAVRDELLGLQASDRDWVVTGATPALMEAAGFTPVGVDFPVFLHPLTHEEYALARTERKTAAGYKGFAFHAAPDVPLEADLQRRDLTVNAMAMSADGELVDPWGGLSDLKNRVLRHVSPAFAEDPVRILRLARFAARFPDFAVDLSTLRFCTDMVNQGEVRALVAERVWQEVSRLLLAPHPAAGWRVLVDCGALGDLAGADAAQGLADTGVLNAALPGQWQSDSLQALDTRWALWMLSAGLPVDVVDSLAARWRVPSDCAELARLCVQQFAAWRVADGTAPVCAVLAASDVVRRPERFAKALAAMQQAALAVRQSPPVLGAAVWQGAADAFRQLAVGDVAKAAQAAGQQVPDAVARARAQAVGQVLAGLLK